MLAYAAMIDDPKEKSRFVRLYEGYQKQMYAVAYRILKDQMLAEDAVQTAFYGIAKNMRSVPSDDEAQIKAYLFTWRSTPHSESWNRRTVKKVLPIS